MFNLRLSLGPTRPYLVLCYTNSIENKLFSCKMMALAPVISLGLAYIK